MLASACARAGECVCECWRVCARVLPSVCSSACASAGEWTSASVCARPFFV